MADKVLLCQKWQNMAWSQLEANINIPGLESSTT